MWSSLLDEFADKKKQAREAYQAYAHRIEELRSDAELDGFSVNEPSERDFWSFAKSVHSVRKAELVLVDKWQPARRLGWRGRQPPWTSTSRRPHAAICNLSTTEGESSSLACGRV